MTIMNIKRGDAPKTVAAIEKAKVRYMNAQGWPEHWRSEAMNSAILSDTTHPLYQQAITALTDFKARIVETQAINTFNAQLAEYRKAAARLTKHRLADGKPEETIETPTGTVDEEGNATATSSGPLSVAYSADVAAEHQEKRGHPGFRGGKGHRGHMGPSLDGERPMPNA